jgi:eukaryotic-like serine/threonine-protein kinase
MILGPAGLSFGRVISNADPRASGGAAYRMLRELGARAQPSYAAIREPHELIVVQRFVRVAPPDVPHARAGSGSRPLPHATPLDAPSMALLLRDARCLARSWHPNIGRVRYVDLVGSELTIATELIEGATLGDLLLEAAARRTAPRDPLLDLSVLVRILLDVLGGLHALHGLRDGMNVPLDAIHGELCPANIVVGKDGVARLIDVLRPRPVRLAEASDAAGYAAPEALDVGGTDDPRADIYSAGVILWEALAGRRLFDETAPSRVLSRQREEEIVPPSIDPRSPFARLADVALRALAFDPVLRFRSAPEMAAELRRVAGARLASGGAVAAQVLDLAGESMRMRRSLLDPAMSGMRPRAKDVSAIAAEVVRPTLSPPVPSRPAVVRASPRVVAPTVAADVPEALLAASRPSLPECADEPSAGDADDELSGPRGSSPELDLEAALESAIAVAEARHAARAEAGEGRAFAISPMTPNIPFASRPAVVPSRRAPAEKTNATPGELVVPISSRDRGTAQASPKRARTAVAVVAAIVVIVCAAAIAMRLGASAAETPKTAPAGLTEAPPTATEVLPSMEVLAPPASPPVLAPTAKATSTLPTARPQSAAPTSRATAPRAPVLTPAPAPVAKPKTSVYEPDEL